MQVWYMYIACMVDFYDYGQFSVYKHPHIGTIQPDCPTKTMDFQIFQSNTEKALVRISGLFHPNSSPIYK